MTKWKYIGIDVREQNINELGEVAWELVSVDGGIAYFKRPIVDDIEMPIEANAPFEMNQEEIGKLNSLKFSEGYFGEWQHKRKEILND